MYTEGVTRSKAAALAAALAAAAPPAAAQTSRLVRGTVRTVEDSLPVSDALVSVLGTPLDAITDSLGRFVIRRAPVALLRLEVRGLSVVPDTVSLPAGRDTLTIYLHARIITLAPAIVRGHLSPARERFETEAQTSTVSLAPAEIASTPGVLEPDVLRTVQLLPGTVARNDYTVGYNVRGGETDQNLIEIDGIPIFNPSHLAGLFSTFDANAISRADFYTGGFPAEYSGRLSSVLDIKLRDGNPTGTDVAGQVSLLSSKVLVDGPLAGGATYLVSARRTYADAVVGALTSDVFPYYFTDLLGKVRVPYGHRGAITTTAYWGRDALNLNLVPGGSGQNPVDLAFDWGNRLAGVTWTQPTGATGALTTRLAVSEFSTTLGLLPTLARLDNTARLLTASTAFRPAPGARHDVTVGAGVEGYRMTYHAGSPALQSTFFDARYAPTVSSFFVDDQWNAGRRLLLRPGVRVEHVSGADFTGVAPRATFKFFLGDNQAISGSVGRYFQAIHSIRDQDLPITIFEFWIGADRYVPVARSDQVVLGYERWLKPDLQFTVEGYRKTYDGLVRPNPAQDLRVQGDEFLPESGTSWGVDVLLRKHEGKIRGWIAYSFGHSVRTSQGETYPPAQDRRHTINVVLQAPGPLGADLGVRWGYGSPLPYTGFVGQWYHRRYDATSNTFQDEEREPIAATYNGERYPPYSRLDVGLHWSFDKWGGHFEPYLQVANVYNRQNVFLYFFDYSDVPATRTGVSQLPFLPTFGLEFQW